MDYSYEHPFSYDWNALKGWHVLMRMGHLLNTLTLAMLGMAERVKKQGIGTTLRFLKETWMGRWVLPERAAALCAQRTPQLRLVI